jgi:hypothetical protein
MTRAADPVEADLPLAPVLEITVGNQDVDAGLPACVGYQSAHTSTPRRRASSMIRSPSAALPRPASDASFVRDLDAHAGRAAHFDGLAPRVEHLVLLVSHVTRIEAAVPRDHFASAVSSSGLA